MLTPETIADLKRERGELLKMPEPTRQQRTAVTTTLKAFKPNHPMYIAAVREKQQQDDATGKGRVAAIDAILAAYGNLPPAKAQTNSAPTRRGKFGPARMAMREMLKERGEMTNAEIVAELRQRGIQSSDASAGMTLAQGTEFDRVDVGVWRLIEFEE